MFRGAVFAFVVALSAVGSAQNHPPDSAAFLSMFARSYVPGRSGQIMIVPREGDVLTRDEPTTRFMHGSPWSYDTRIPLFFVGPQVTPGVHTTPARQQDVAVTVARALGASMPSGATGRVLPVLRPDAPRPRAAFVLVLDGMRVDYFDRYANQMPTLSALRKRAAWFSNARVNYLPTATGIGHSTVSTGTDPRIHGITGNNLYDRAKRTRHDMYQGWNPRDLMALTLTDVWQLSTGGRAIIIAQGSSAPSATALAGHGACQVGGSRFLHAGYDQIKGVWSTNEECFTLLPGVAALDAKTLWPPDGTWMGHKVDSPSEVRYSGLFPRFEAEAFIRMLDSQPIGADAVPDLLLLNFKGADYVGHKHGPDSKEMSAALSELDTHLARIFAALEAKVGRDYLLAVTADHGMPSEPPAGRSRQIAADVMAKVNAALDPERKAVMPYYEPENAQMFVDLDRLAELKLTLNDVAAYLRKQPFVYAAFTEDEVRRAAAALK
jgi:hypothetical protein